MRRNFGQRIGYEGWVQGSSCRSGFRCRELDEKRSFPGADPDRAQKIAMEGLDSRLAHLWHLRLRYEKRTGSGQQHRGRGGGERTAIGQETPGQTSRAERGRGGRGGRLGLPQSTNEAETALACRHMTQGTSASSGTPSSRCSAQGSSSAGARRGQFSEPRWRA